MTNDVAHECKMWEDIIRSNEDYLDRYAELNPYSLRHGKVRDVIIFSTLGPDDYRYDPDTATDLKDFPKTVNVARFNRTLDLLEGVRDDFALTDQQTDHLNAILGFMYWAVGLHEEAVDSLYLLDEPTELAMLTAQALAMGIPGYFAPSN